MNGEGNNVPVNDQDKVEKLRALEEFLKNQPADESHVRHIDQNIEVRIAGSRLYFPSFTKSWMDQQANKPIHAVTVQTDPTTYTVYFWPDAKGERKLVFSETMGGASVAFGVPLKKLNLNFRDSRRIVLPLHCDELPTMGAVFSICFNEQALEGRNVDKELVAAAKQVQTAVEKVRKEIRIKRTLSRMPKPDTSTNT
jgi:hypothetical protein